MPTVFKDQQKGDTSETKASTGTEVGSGLRRAEPGDHLTKNLRSRGSGAQRHLSAGALASAPRCCLPRWAVRAGAGSGPPVAQCPQNIQKTS